MANAAPDSMAMITQLLARMVANDEARLGHPRPKAIQCRMYKLGDSWPDFATHFVECIKVSYNFTLPADQRAIDAACVSWLPSKLEPGAALVAYDALSDAVKAVWDDLVDALRNAFADDTERELFLADIAAYRRGGKGLVEYKNELLRRMKLYQPGLSGVPAEFQRQATSRFIEGMEDAELKKELRRHCKRDKLNIDEAFNYAVDSEASELQTKIRDGDAAAFVPKSFASVNIQSQGGKPVVMSREEGGMVGQIRGIHEEIKGLSAKHKISELQIQEISARNALTDDRITIVSKEVGQVAVNMAKLESSLDHKLGKIESLILASHSANSGQSNPPAQYGAHYGANTNHFQRQPQYRPRGGLPYAQAPRQFRPQQQLQPSITGGAGYINNQVRPTHYRMQDPQLNVPVRPSASASVTTTAPATSTAAFGAIGSPPMAPSINTNAAATAATAAAFSHPRTDPQQQQYNVEDASWWSPGMSTLGATGYDSTLEGTYSYGEDFWQQ